MEPVTIVTDIFVCPSLSAAIADPGNALLRASLDARSLREQA